MDSNTKTSWKQKIIKELVEYFFNVIYLALFFSVFTWYQRLILAQHQINYLHYGISIIEALIFGKIVMIGDILHLGRRLEEKPLIFSTLYKSVVFSALIALFTIIEHTIRGLIAGKGFMEGVTELISKDQNELIAKSLVIFCAFIPFFAFKELERILGKGKIGRIFLKNPSKNKKY